MSAIDNPQEALTGGSRTNHCIGEESLHLAIPVLSRNAKALGPAAARDREAWSIAILSMD